jgi:membrane fusion protein (multidrug efflux system)
MAEPYRSQEETPAPEEATPKRKSRVAHVVIIILLAIGIFFGVRYYLEWRQYESTDDAFIEGDIVQVAPQVPGRVTEVPVKENQEVKAGDLLVQIDPEPYQVRLEQARAAARLAEAQQKTAELNVGLTETTSGAVVEQAQSGVAAAEEQVATSRASLTAAEAEADRARKDLQRYESLADSIISRQHRDQAAAASRVANAKVEEARKQVAAAEAQVGAARGSLQEAKSAPQQVNVRSSEVQSRSAQIEEANTSIRAAELNLSYTKIVAPAAGRITKKSVEPGEYVQPGQTLLALVPNKVWVVANFKETQLTHVQPGKPVEIQIDAYPDKVFRGHVDSIQAGTGARFSLLPPENATGNYVKVVQRVPVKILFDEAPGPDYHLGPGMSVVPRVKIQ